MADAGVRKGFIILKANDQPMRKVSDLEEVMKAAVKSPNQVLFLTGVFPSGKRGYYAVDLTQEWFSWKVLCRNSPQSSTEQSITEQSITEFFTTNQQLKIVSVLLCVFYGEFWERAKTNSAWLRDEIIPDLLSSYFLFHLLCLRKDKGVPPGGWDYTLRTWCS